MNNIETMKLALEALLEDRAWLESDAPKEAWDKNNQAITSLRQAIEQDNDCKHCTDGCPACDARRQPNVLP